jgi:hypothetical protein
MASVINVSALPEKWNRPKTSCPHDFNRELRIFSSLFCFKIAISDARRQLCLSYGVQRLPRCRLTYEVAGNKLLVLLALSGLISGLLVCALMPPGQQEAGLYCGVVFGSFLAVPLAISRILDSGILYSILKSLGLIVVTTTAYFFSFLTAFGVQRNFPQIVPASERWDMGTNEPASAIAFFVGGLVGGFLLFAGVIFLSRPWTGRNRREPTRRIGHLRTRDIRGFWTGCKECPRDLLAVGVLVET